MIDMGSLLSWLDNHVGDEDVIPGAAFVGIGRGWNGHAWHVHDPLALVGFISQNNAAKKMAS